MKSVSVSVSVSRWNQYQWNRYQGEVKGGWIRLKNRISSKTRIVSFKTKLTMFEVIANIIHRAFQVFNFHSHNSSKRGFIAKNRWTFIQVGSHRSESRSYKPKSTSRWIDLKSASHCAENWMVFVAGFRFLMTRNTCGK